MASFVSAVLTLLFVMRLSKENGNLFSNNTQISNIYQYGNPLL